MVFDKTGTLTANRLEVLEVTPRDPAFDVPALLGVAAAADRRSAHPLATAVADAAGRHAIALPEPERFEQLQRRGVKAGVEGRVVLVGKAALQRESGVPLDGAVEGGGRTPVHVAVDGRLAGVIFIADALRPGAKAALAALRASGVRRIVMLTGDNAAAAQVVASALGVDELRADLMPEGKVAAIADLQRQGHRVAMVGDGVNDAETASNRLDAVFEVSGKVWLDGVQGELDNHFSGDGRVMVVLSEHLCEGWLEGYLLTGRHGLFSCCQAFIHIVDSMFNQHAKWLKVCNQIAWRKPIASLNYLLTSHVWRHDDNGFSHQDPGFIDHVASKKADGVRIYLPPDANTLLSVADHCLRSRNYVNLIIAGKRPAPQWLDMDAAVRHCAAGAGVWAWASNDAGVGQVDPDVVMASAGDVPTLEALAAVTLLRVYVPDIRIRFVNVVDLMVLQPPSEHPHGLADADFDALVTPDKPVVFAFHGYPAIIHKLTYRRRNHANIHVRGYQEEGTTTTPFDMVVLNNGDRFQLALDAVRRIPRLAAQVEAETARFDATRQRHKRCIAEHGDDMPEILGWRWSRAKA